MSLYALETICNDEQKRQFLPLAHSYDITTAYAETEAVFVRATDSFVLHLHQEKSAQMLSQLIEVGVNGVRFVYNLDDNSYLRLKNVRIPHTQMPMKWDEVDEKGSNIKI
ncbi:unnamed protein product [Adineta ricciae]|uniref:Uncharacterized protein n=1 Tax=Adineta ricciae TaxID=249248 RepID=A0A815TUR0_ADIRI|nr:unnamed protein product [Adineta ricciae]